MAPKRGLQSWGAAETYGGSPLVRSTGYPGVLSPHLSLRNSHWTLGSQVSGRFLKVREPLSSLLLCLKEKVPLHWKPAAETRNYQKFAEWEPEEHSFRTSVSQLSAVPPQCTTSTKLGNAQVTSQQPFVLPPPSLLWCPTPFSRGPPSLRIASPKLIVVLGLCEGWRADSWGRFTKALTSQSPLYPRHFCPRHPLPVAKAFLVWYLHFSAHGRTSYTPYISTQSSTPTSGSDRLIRQWSQKALTPTDRP